MTGMVDLLILEKIAKKFKLKSKDQKHSFSNIPKTSFFRFCDFILTFCNLYKF